MIISLLPTFEYKITQTSMSTDSSSSDEEFEKLKEAVDSSFLTNTLFENDTKKPKTVKEPKPLPSLRNQNHEESLNNPFSIKVTPEFQKYVSKHLTKMLDEIIDDSKSLCDQTKRKSRKIKSVVKLLKSSKDYLSSTSDFSNGKVNNTKKRYTNVEELEEYEKAKQVAVSPEWVLSQEETKHWAKCTKGEVEVIKINGTSSKINYKKVKLK